MKDKSFFDTNILIYLFSDEAIKHKKARDLFILIDDKIISIQVLNEFANVCYKGKS